jgi:hypothetical protein
MKVEKSIHSFGLSILWMIVFAAVVVAVVVNAVASLFCDIHFVALHSLLF